MKLGMHLRNMGPQSTRETLTACAKAAESAGIDSLWVNDHIAIPAEESEGSEGRYIDPLTTLAYLAGITERIGLGTAVLIVPYRPALATAKWIASIQELSAERLTLGVGVGWMPAEFKATGVERSRRGAITDETLEIFHHCFAADEVEVNEQRFLFRPRPARPPILVGGKPPHAFERIAKFAEGWLPTSGDPVELGPAIAQLTTVMAAAGKSAPQVVPLMALQLDDPARAAAQIEELAAVGVTGLIHTHRYQSSAEFAKTAELLASL